MPRQPDPRKEKARELWEQSGGTLTLRAIADQLDLKENTVSCWKSRDGWGKKKDCSTANKKRSTAKRRGGQPGNQNAVGHGRPAEHGLISNRDAKRTIESDPSQFNNVMAEMPEDILEIMSKVESEDPVDLQRNLVNFQFAAIVQSYRYIQEYAESAALMLNAARSLRPVYDDDGKPVDGADEATRFFLVQQAMSLAAGVINPDKRAGYVMALNKAISEFHRSVRMYYKEAKGHEDKINDAKIAKMNAEVDKLERSVGDKEVHIHHAIPTEQQEA